MTSRRLSNQIAEWVEEALDTYLLGDTCQHDVTIVVDQQAGPLVLVLLWMPSAILGEQLQVVGAMPNPANVTAEQVNGFVHEGLEAMRKQRSQQTQTSGLVLPGAR